MEDLEARTKRLERDMHMLIAKMAVWEVAVATLLEFLAKSTPDPKQAIMPYRDAVKQRAAQISYERWPDDKAWMKAINESLENFEQLLKFSFDDTLSGKPPN